MCVNAEHTAFPSLCSVSPSCCRNTHISAVSPSFRLFMFPHRLFFFVSPPCSFLFVSLLFFRFCSLLLMFHHYCSNAVQCTALNGLFSPCKMEQNKLKKTSYASVLDHSLDQSDLPLWSLTGDVNYTDYLFIIAPVRGWDILGSKRTFCPHSWSVRSRKNGQLRAIVRIWQGPDCDG